jgi:hypothetical protein
MFTGSKVNDAIQATQQPRVAVPLLPGDPERSRSNRRKKQNVLFPVLALQGSHPLY